jgi:ClpP class serine protease
MVDHAYLEFLQVVEQGRPSLKGKLQDDILIDEVVKIREGEAREKKVKYTRYRADGGIWVADEAMKYGLIDQIGYLEDAIKVAKQAAGLSDDYRAVNYERPPSFLGAWLGIKTEPPSMQLDVSKLADAATPRLWYLAPQSDLAGILAAAERR